MGKAKTRRQKYHASAARAKQRNEAEKNEPQEAADAEMTDANTLVETSSVLGGGVFKGLDINLGNATKELPDFDARSTITSKTFKGLNVTKKEKRKLKHEAWMKRVDTIQAVRKEVRERKKRQKTAIVGDMKPLEDSLPTLELLLRDTSSQQKHQREETKPKSTKKTKTRQKNMLKDIDIFKQVVQHPVFKKDPGATLLEHLRNKQKLEDADT